MGKEIWANKKQVSTKYLLQYQNSFSVPKTCYNPIKQAVGTRHLLQHWQTERLATSAIKLLQHQYMGHSTKTEYQVAPVCYSTNYTHPTPPMLQYQTMGPSVICLSQHQDMEPSTICLSRHPNMGPSTICLSQPQINTP